MVDNSDADASGKWVNKWKAPPWLKPGTKVRVARGRKFPIGITGQCLAILDLGAGLEPGRRLPLVDPFAASVRVAVVNHATTLPCPASTLH
jgi:hypothetical protein